MIKLFRIPAILCVVLFCSASLISCGSKSKGGGDVQEANLVVETTPAFNSVQPAAPGPDFDLAVVVKSPMPSGGVTVSVSAAPEEGGGNFFTDSRTNTNPTNTFVIKNTPSQKACIVTVKVTSVNKPSNTLTGTYRYSRK